MDTIKKQRTLKMFLMQYLLTLIISVIVSILVPCIIFAFLLNIGFIEPANQDEIIALNLKSKLENTQITESSIPNNLDYIILDKSLKIIKTNLDNNERIDALNYLNGKNIGKVNPYVYIKGTDTHCLLKYQLKPTYAYKKLNLLMPSPNILLILTVIINILSCCAISVFIFSKKLNQQLLPLITTTKQINIQNLDFPIIKSGIKDFNSILDSIIDMKNELKSTLKEKWEEDKLKSHQLSALAHDIKTPLTIIKGNTQLLLESDSLEENKLYGEFILNGAKEIEDYISILSSALHAGKSLNIQKSKLSTHDFIKNLKKSAYSLFKTKNILLKTNYSNVPYYINCDSKYLYRALLNILSNAFEYSPKNSTVYLELFSDKNYLYFKIYDEGRGFSKQGIKCANKIFYTEDKSRSQNQHYGLGLYLATNVAKYHGGTLILNNSCKTSGAEILFSIKL